MATFDCGDHLLPLRSIRVTELNSNVTEGVLFEKFSPIGSILSLRLHKDAVTQKCNGVAHITFYRSNDAQQAFDSLNNTLIMGDPMMLYWAEEDTDIVKYRVESFFVDNLNTDIDDEGVEALFVSYGKILYCTINRDTQGNSLSTAYVHYKSGCRFKELMKHLNGAEVNGHRITIQHMRAPDDIPFTNIYVKYLSSNVENVDLHKMFIGFGAINSCIVMKNSDGTSKHFGFVNFEEAQAARNAVDNMHLSMNSQKQIMHVMRADTKPTIPSSLRQFEGQLGKPLLSYLFVDNIGANVTELQVRREFEPFLNLKGVKRMSHKDKHYAYVFYSNSTNAEQAVRSMAEKMNKFKNINIGVLNRFEHPSFFSQTCAVPVIARGLYSPEVDLSWEVYWQVHIIPTCEQGQKWKIYQLCRAEMT